MTSKTLKSAIWLTMAASAVVLAAGGVAYGKGKPTDPGGGGGKPPTEATNNLSVPAIMAGGMGAFGALSCNTTEFTDLMPPDKAPLEYPASCATSRDGTYSCVDAGFYYVQRNAKWQAPCLKVDVGTPVYATGAWGDNLGGDASLKVGSPIRVELVLWDSAAVGANETGYKVIKLEPTELDRLSDYGHLATKNDIDEWQANPMALGTIVHDPAARLKIEKIVDGLPVSTVYDQPAGGEINATGKIVYGYGLRVLEAGTYRITYSFTNVVMEGCDIGTCEGNTAVLEIEVAAGGGGGGRK